MALTESQIQELYIAYFGRPADVEGKNYWSGSSAGVSTQAEFAAIMHAQSEFQNTYGSLSTAAQVDQIYQNLFSRAADATGLAYWTKQISNGTLKLAEIATHLIYAAKNNAGSSADKTALENKTSSATAFTTDVEADASAQLAYTADDADAFTTAKTFITGVTTAAATAAEVDTQVASIKSTYTTNNAKGVTYSLATGADDLTGGAKNDTFSGVVDADTAASNTFTALDSIDGGAGTDTLAVTFASDAGNTNTFPAATITNVETFSIKNQDDNDAVTISFANIAGETTVQSNLSTQGVTFTNLASGTNADIIGNGSLTNGAFAYGYVAAATASTLDIMDGVTAGAVTETGTGLLSSTITSTGAANTIGALGIAATVTGITIDATTNLTTGAITSNAATSLTITGAGDVDVNAGALGATITTVTGSASTGDIDVTMGNVAADATNPGTVDIADVTVNTGSGADEVSVANVVTGRELAVNTGAGNDLVTIGSALTNSSTTSAGDVINGGAGTDTLSMTTAIANGHATTTDVSGFETITISDHLNHTLQVADFGTGISTVNLTLGTDAADGASVTFNAGASVLNLADVADGTLTVTDTGTATTDSITFNITDADDTDAYSGEAFTITGFETATINTTNSTTTATTTTAQTIGAVTITADTGGTTTLNVSGNRALTAGVITANTIDASGMTAAFSNTGAAMVGTADGTNTLTGGSGNDTLVGDANDTTNITGGAGDDNITGGSDAETISGGAGADTIAGGGGNDVITGGDGNDTITLGGATETVDAGAGDDTVNAAGNLAFGYAIVGGAGTDILDVEAAEVIGDGSVVSGFETLQIDGDLSIDLDTYSNNTFTTVVLDDSDYGTISSARSEVFELTGVLGGAAAITLEDATGTSDSLTLRSKAADALTQTAALTIAGTETINIITDDTEDAGFEQDTIILTAANTTTLNLTGDAGVVLSGGTYAALTTVDGSGATIEGVSTASTVAGITLASDLTGVGETISYTGTNGVDTFTGHANTDDTFVGGLGADHLNYTGRLGNFTGGGGADTFDLDAVTNSNYTTAFLTITDIEDGDIIDFADIDAGTDTWTTTEIELGSSATLKNYLDNAVSGNTGHQNTAVKWFRYGGDTYLAFDRLAATTWTDGSDFMIKMTGSKDISGSTLGTSTLTIDVA